MGRDVEEGLKEIETGWRDEERWREMKVGEERWRGMERGDGKR